MKLAKIEINNFRNFQKNTFNFSDCLTIILGKNSIGKTNLLESIYFTLRGNGFREKKEEELICEKCNELYSTATLKDSLEKKELRIVMQKSNSQSYESNKIVKVYFINKVKKISREYQKNSFPAVIFSPNLMFVIDGDPSERREYFDSIIGSFDNEYKKRLSNYETGLRKRNKIIEKEIDKNKLKENLKFWDNYLIEQADYLVSKRQDFCEFLNSNPKVDSKNMKIIYEPKILSHITLADTFEKQFLIKRTLVGPQRDNFEIFLNDKNVHKFGSRSEQRLALFWIILNEIKLYEEKLNIKPLILLDDIFSELDINNKKVILSLIKNHQTIMTTTEKEIVKEIECDFEIIKL